MARVITGRVTSDKGDKTIVITVTERRTHPLYKKQYTVNTKFMAHDETNEAKVGDIVNIVESRPMSANKRFKLGEIVEAAKVHFEESDAVADLPEEPEVDAQVAEAESTAPKKAVAKKPQGAKEKTE